MSNPWYMGLVEAGRAIAARKLSSVELTTAILERITALGPKLHAYATVTADQALEQAKAAEAHRALGARETTGKVLLVP